MPVHRSHFCESGTISMNLKPQTPYIWRTSSIRITGSDVRMITQVSGIFPTKICKPLDARFSVAHVAGWSLRASIHWGHGGGSLHRPGSWAAGHIFVGRPGPLSLGSSPRPPESLEPQVEDDIKPEAWGGMGRMVADWMPNSMQPGVQRLYAHVFTSNGFLKLGIPLITELSYFCWGTHFFFKVSPSWKHTQIGLGSTELLLPWRTVRKALMRPAWLDGDGSGFRMNQSDWRLFTAFWYERVQKNHLDYWKTSTWDSRWINDVSLRVLQDEPFTSILSL